MEEIIRQIIRIIIHRNQRLPFSQSQKSHHVFDRTKPDGLIIRDLYVISVNLCQDKLLSLSQLLWGDIVLIDEQYLICQAK